MKWKCRKRTAKVVGAASSGGFRVTTTFIASVQASSKTGPVASGAFRSICGRFHKQQPTRRVDALTVALGHHIKGHHLSFADESTRFRQVGWIRAVRRSAQTARRLGRSTSHPRLY